MTLARFKKTQFSNLFIAAVLLLMTLPLLITSQDLITQILKVTSLSGFIQNYIVPIEVKFVVALLQIVGITASADTQTIVLLKGTQNVYQAQIIWSCIGWQSLVLIVVTLITGLKGNFSLASKLETIIIGVMGTFWINIIRITLIYIIGFHLGQLPAYLFHNLAGTLMAILWLFVLWWFAYTFVLEKAS